MKGKKILALTSIFAGVALVGSTFAAWAVTDNADPFGVKVSPGTIATDTIDYVTLSYGDRTYANIEGLAVGSTRLAATVGLKADTSNSASYTGKFSVTLIDQTTGKQEGDKKLVDYLTVDVYDVAIEANGNGVVTTDLSKLTSKGTFNASHLTGDVNVTVTDNVAKNVYVTVGLASSVTASILEEIRSDVVYIQMNWNSNGTDEVEASKVYLKYSSAGKKAYCFAWTATKTTGGYPGLLMEDEGNGLYSIDLSLEYSDLLFVVKNTVDGEEIYKTADLQLSSQARTQTPCYTVSTTSWTAVPASVEAGYYVVGSINSWTPSAAYKMTAEETANHYKLENVQLAAGDKIKVRDASGDNWYGSGFWTGCGFTIDDDGNVTIDESGVYTVHVNIADLEGHYIYLSK